MGILNRNPPGRTTFICITMRLRDVGLANKDFDEFVDSLVVASLDTDFQDRIDYIGFENMADDAESEPGVE